MSDNRVTQHVSAERVSWDKFRDETLDYQQDEHVTLIGTTGCGKTTLELELAQMRDYVLFLSTKSEDDTQEELVPLGFRVAKTPSEVNIQVARKWVVKPKIGKNDDADTIVTKHRKVFRETLMQAFHSGRWAVFIDEGRYICDFLGLKKEVTLLYLQGRSQHNSNVIGTQRPRFVPLETFDAATHLFFWKDNDDQNIKRIAELAGLNRSLVLEVVPRLDDHTFLYYNTRTGQTAISKVEV